MVLLSGFFFSKKKNVFFKYPVCMTCFFFFFLFLGNSGDGVLYFFSIFSVCHAKVVQACLGTSLWVLFLLSLFV